MIYRYKHITRKLYLCMMLIVGSLICLVAQEGQNPFDITNKPVNIDIPVIDNAEDTLLQGEEIGNSDTDLSIPIPSSPVIEGNPFEINGDSPISTTAKPTQKRKKPSLFAPKGKKAGETNSGFLFLIMILMMLIFAALMTIFRSLVGKIYGAFVNNSQLSAAYREMGSTIAMPYLILYIMYFINGGVFLYLLATHHGVDFGGNWLTLGYVLGGLCLIFAAKHLLLKFIGWVFPISKEVDIYNFSIIIFNIVIGIILIPFNLLLAYSPDSLTVGIIYTFAIVMVAIYIYRSVRGLLIGSQYISMHKFHFFMYLCSVEIVPLLILMKFISNFN